MYMYTIWKQLWRVYRRQKISKGQSKQDNSERQDRVHKAKPTNTNTICIGHHYAQANTNNVNNKKDCKIQLLK